jgi:sugar/nucleoside kinase (ribokinase family)
VRAEYDVVVALDTCVDLLVRGGDVSPEFGQKEKLVGDYSVVMGGSTCIFACQAAKLGLRVAGVGAVGDDEFGRFMRSSLAGAGVDVSGLRTAAGVKTGIAIALCREGGDRAIITHLGSADGAVETDLPDQLVAASRHIHVGSYYLMRALRPSYPRILASARRHGVSVSLDPNWDPDERWDGVTDLLPFVDILLPNENEARALAGKDVPADALNELGTRVATVAMKQGRLGAVVHSSGAEARAPAVDVAVADTVGAGDSFDAGFLWAWLAGLPPEMCLRAGTLCGSLSTRLPGGTAGQPDERELRALLDG